MQNSAKKVKPRSRAELESLRQKVAELANEKPKKAAIILTRWINNPQKAPTNKKI